ncbi:MAG: S-methyl-5'-thioinosine phosphorylase, partial [Pseudomonadales bacterium]
MAHIGLIVGSGALSWDPGWREEGGTGTAFGDASAPLRVAAVAGHVISAIARHGVPHRFAPHAVNYRANLTLLAEAGVEVVIALNTVGGISPFATTGALLVPDEIIDYSWGRQQTFSPDDAVRHIDFSLPYDQRLRQVLLDAGRRAGLELHDGGVMGVTQGPRLETAAEIRRMARDGCDMVGMTGMPEAALARELDLPFAALAMVVNPAAGLADRVIDLAEIQAASARCMKDAIRLVEVLLEGFVGLEEIG